MDRRRSVSGLFLLTIVGALLLLPPFALLFNRDSAIFGVPQIVLYLFAVWFALIVGTALLNRHLRVDPPDDGDGEA